MQESRTSAWLLAALLLAWQSTACGSMRSGTTEGAAAGSSSDNGGSVPDGPSPTAGGGALPSSGGSPALGGSTSGEGGSAGLGGIAGVAGAAAGGTGGIGGAGGGTGGADGGTADGGSGGSADDPQKLTLFDGSQQTFNDWVSRNDPNKNNPWTDNGDGTMTVRSGGGDILSKHQFRNVFVHLEYMIPNVHLSSFWASQGNSGVVLNGSYELQILALDAFADESLVPTTLTCGAVYAFAAPLEVACHQEGWNTYDIEFQAPACDGASGKTVTTPARFVEVKLNGTLIHQNVEVTRQTQATLNETCQPRGVLLQDWSTDLPVSFRNIWAIPRN